MFKQFVPFDFSAERFWDFLRKEVDSYSGNLDPLRNTLSALLGPLNCRGVVAEREYVDKDFQDEFSAYYSKSFKIYTPRCLRLHFFSRRITHRQIDRYNLPADSYLGFIVFRSIDLQRMGRTILRPHVSDKNHAFITCRAKFTAHIYGQDLVVEGMPFIQQDTQVGACAQASLWMLARYMSRRFHYREYLPAEINQFAKSRNAQGRVFPAEKGLTHTQMLDALQAMGLSAEFYWKDQLDDYSPHFNSVPTFQRSKKLLLTAKLADIAYRYIESGLPVLFGMRAHALVGVGHGYSWRKRARVAIERIPCFYVNNDAKGPYQEMPVLQRKPDLDTFVDVESIFVVAPHEATLRGEDAEDMAKDALDYLLHRENRKLLKQIRAMRPDLSPLLGKLEHRTYLRSSVDFQKELLANVKGNNNGQASDQLLRMDFPKFVWITEVSTPKLLNHEDKKERKCLGRIIVDSTAAKGTFGAMAMHFADCLIIHDRQKAIQEAEAWKSFVFPQSTPFVHMFTSDARGDA